MGGQGHGCDGPEEEGEVEAEGAGVHVGRRDRGLGSGRSKCTGQMEVMRGWTEPMAQDGTGMDRDRGKAGAGKVAGGRSANGR